MQPVVIATKSWEVEFSPRHFRVVTFPELHSPRLSDRSGDETGSRFDLTGVTVFLPVGGGVLQFDAL